MTLHTPVPLLPDAYDARVESRATIGPLVPPPIVQVCRDVLEHTLAESSLLRHHLALVGRADGILPGLVS
jgi:hypothetical protein